MLKDRDRSHYFDRVALLGYYRIGVSWCSRSVLRWEGLLSMGFVSAVAGSGSGAGPYHCEVR